MTKCKNRGIKNDFRCRGNVWRGGNKTKKPGGETRQKLRSGG
jgi:hypothetical protein